jgi:hypothetical protein
MTETFSRCAFLSDLPVLDAPAEATADAAPATSTLTLAQRGVWKSPVYGTIRISKGTLDAFAANFANGIPGDKLPIDVDHVADRGGATKAVGWVTSVEVDGDRLLGHAEWTDEGEQLVASGAYAWISPVWTRRFQQPDGQGVADVVLGASLTNKPFFSQWPSVVLNARDFRSDFPDVELLEPLREAAGGDPSDEQVAAFSGDLEATIGALGHVPAPAMQRLLANIAVLAEPNPVKPMVPVRDERLAKLVASLPTVVPHPAAKLPPEELREPPVDTESERARLDRRAKTLAAATGLNLAVCWYLVQADDEVQAAEADDGRSDVEWQDTSRALPVVPYGPASVLDRERDERRAASAGVQVPAIEWQYSAEQGVDLVHERAAAHRAARVEQARAERDGLLQAAKDAARHRAAG